MCGIIGQWRFEGVAIDAASFRHATTRLRHRGPDDEGYLLADTRRGVCRPCAGQDTDPRLRLPGLLEVAAEHGAFDLALGFRRLAILDLSPAGHQPMAAVDGRKFIVFNGELYNYRQLRAQLAQLGREFRTQSDTEVVLAAYLEWGQSCLDRFNGMWAFAVYDANERSLFLARDRFGVKPLFYRHTSEGFAFASEAKAIFGMSPTAAFTPAELALARFLALGALPDPQSGETFFDGIRSLPPGHMLMVRDGRVSEQRYYSLPESAAPTSIDAAAVAQEYRELFTDSVRLRLQADVPVGTCLSGGLDSSSIFCVVDQLLRSGDPTAAAIGHRQRAFSAVYNNGASYDERSHIETVLASTRATGNFVVPDPAVLQREISAILWHQEEPIPTSSMFAQWSVMRLVRSSGVTVLLDGQGADEALGGYQPFDVHVAGLIGRGSPGAAIREAYAARAVTRVPLRRTLGRAVLWQLPKPVLTRLRHASVRAASRRACLTEASRRSLTAAVPPWAGQDSGLQQHLQALVLRTSLPHLLRYEDRNSMAFGIEARVPFLDYRLVEFAFTRAAGFRIRDGWTKWILRESMTGTVPDPIIWRRDKVGYETPESAWLRDWVKGERGLLNDDAELGAYVNPAAVRVEISRWARAGGRSNQVWRWLIAQNWLRLWREGAPAAVVQN